MIYSILNIYLCINIYIVYNSYNDIIKYIFELHFPSSVRSIVCSNASSVIGYVQQVVDYRLSNSHFCIEATRSTKLW